MSFRLALFATLVLLSSTDRSSPAAWPTGGAVVKNGRGAVGDCPGCGRMSGIMHVLPLKTPSFAIENLEKDG